MDKLIDIFILGKWSKLYKIIFKIFFALISIWITNYFVNKVGYQYSGTVEVKEIVGLLLSERSIVVIFILFCVCGGIFISNYLMLVCLWLISFFMPIVFRIFVFVIFIQVTLLGIFLLRFKKMVSIKHFYKEFYDEEELNKMLNTDFAKWLLNDLQDEKTNNRNIAGSKNILMIFLYILIVFKMYNVDEILPVFNTIIFYCLFIYTLNGAMIHYLVRHRITILHRIGLLIPVDDSVNDDSTIIVEEDYTQGGSNDPNQLSMF